MLSSYISAFVGTFSFLLIGTAALAKDCVGVVPAGGGHAFWNEVKRGAQQAGQELGIDIYYRGPSDERNPDDQKEILKIILQRHCKALVLAPSAPERAVEVKQFASSGVPTVYIDRDFGNSDAIAFVATDNYRAGMLAGQHMVRMLPKQGKVAVFRMQRGVQSTDDREKGFIAIAKAAGLSIVLDTWVGSNIGDARGHMLERLKTIKSPIDGIFTPNESTTEAALATLETLKLAGKIKLIGFDMTAGFITALRNGTLAATVVQRPFQMGYQGVAIAVGATHGKMPAKHSIDSGAFLVTQTMLNAPEYKQDLAPFFKPSP